MTHEESKLQQSCVAWFRMQYPHFASLLTHPANEGNGNAVTGAIHKAEGTVPGVPDLLLFLPARYGKTTYHGFGIEMKTLKGRQSPAQKTFQAMFQAAGYHYFIVRTLEEFISRITEYMNHMPLSVKNAVESAHRQEADNALQRDRTRLQKILSKS